MFLNQHFVYFKDAVKHLEIPIGVHTLLPTFDFVSGTRERGRRAKEGEL